MLLTWVAWANLFARVIEVAEEVPEEAEELHCVLGCGVSGMGYGLSVEVGDR